MATAAQKLKAAQKGKASVAVWESSINPDEILIQLSNISDGEMLQTVHCLMAISGEAINKSVKQYARERLMRSGKSFWIHLKKNELSAFPVNLNLKDSNIFNKLKNALSPCICATQ